MRCLYGAVLPPAASHPLPAAEGLAATTSFRHAVEPDRASTSEGFLDGAPDVTLPALSPGPTHHALPAPFRLSVDFRPSDPPRYRAGPAPQLTRLLALLPTGLPSRSGTPTRPVLPKSPPVRSWSRLQARLPSQIPVLAPVRFPAARQRLGAASGHAPPPR